jgi:hypothetical protein
MQQATAFYNFSNACERFLFSLTTTHWSLTEAEAQLIAYDCKEIVAKIDPCLSKSSRQSLMDLRKQLHAMHR